MNQVTPLMAVLRGIDQFVYQSRIDGERRWKAKGPLNMVKKDGSAIYFKSIPFVCHSLYGLSYDKKTTARTKKFL